MQSSILSSTSCPAFSTPCFLFVQFLSHHTISVDPSPLLWMVDHSSTTNCYLPSFFTSSELYCMVTEAQVCKHTAECCYIAKPKPTTSQLQVLYPTIVPARH